MVYIEAKHEGKVMISVRKTNYKKYQYRCAVCDQKIPNHSIRLEVSFNSHGLNKISVHPDCISRVGTMLQKFVEENKEYFTLSVL